MDPLPRAPQYHPEVTVDLTLRVSDLMEPASGNWDLRILRQLFVEEEIPLIMRINTRRDKDDTIRWGFSRNGIYDSKSGYKLLENILKDQQIWEKRLQGLIKCNVGSVWSAPSENGGAAWLTRDSSGTALAHSRRSGVGIRSQLEADLLALVWSMEALIDLKHKKVIIEISSSRIPAAMSVSSIPWDLHPLLKRLKRALDRFDECQLAFVHQGSNTVADSIARSVVQHRRYQSYIARNGPKLVGLSNPP
ncbi:uncharacterized protein LOC125579787 [Brassica napus]|uniref:uncharacterized protein LOC125579787 n=1 Tax=Brassica napus TaxID=3708 RepID=UPI0020787D1C|nr:uncharacterized protein LOC125579787 [Brassica napus]